MGLLEAVLELMRAVLAFLGAAIKFLYNLIVSGIAIPTWAFLVKVLKYLYGFIQKKS